MEYKYIKYKHKYLLLKKQLGGNNEIPDVITYLDNIEGLSSDIPDKYNFFYTIIEGAAIKKLQITKEQIDIFKTALNVMIKTGQIVYIINEMPTNSLLTELKTINFNDDNIDNVKKQCDDLYNNNKDKEIFCKLMSKLIILINDYFNELSTIIPELKNEQFTSDNVKTVYDSINSFLKEFITMSGLKEISLDNDETSNKFDIDDETKDKDDKSKDEDTEDENTEDEDTEDEDTEDEDTEDENTNTKDKKGGSLKDIPKLITNPFVQKIAKNMASNALQNLGIDEKMNEQIMIKLTPLIAETRESINIIFALIFTILYLNEKCESTE
jgi:hypothetical protein